MEKLIIICNRKYFPIIGFLLGVILFVMIYGVRILNPCFVDWLFGHGDLSQHYLGWEFYRKADWHFPIGMTDNLAYPIQTSIIFTDSILHELKYYNVSDFVVGVTWLDDDGKINDFDY